MKTRKLLTCSIVLSLLLTNLLLTGSWVTLARATPDSLKAADVTGNTRTASFLLSSPWSDGDSKYATSSVPVVTVAGPNGAGTSYTISNQPAGTYYYRVKASNSSGDSGWSNTQSATVSPPGQGIHGRVTFQGNPIGGLALALRLCNKTGTNTWSCSNLLTTSTQSDGTYRFLGAPGLGTDQRYYVRFDNSANPSYLGAWGTQSLSSYAAGSSVAIGDFDVADIPLVSPAPGATVALPYTFQWTRRTATPSDNYELDLYDPNPYGSWWWTDPTLGYVASYTLNSLPYGFSIGQQYEWEVWAYDGLGGYGYSYGHPLVTFSSGQASLRIEGQGAFERARHWAQMAADDRLDARLMRRNADAWRTISNSLPDAPTLYPISNSDGDGNYTVSWSTAALATGYTLQEATNAGFTDARVIYQVLIPPVELSSGYLQEAAAGAVVNYTHILTNTSDVTHTFQVRATNSHGWVVTLADNSWPGGTPVLPLIDVGPYATRTFAVSVTISAGATPATVAQTYITATLQTTPTIYASATDTTTVKYRFAYLPLVARCWPLVPGLFPISNSDGDGKYTVSWAWPSCAPTSNYFELQSDDDPGFSNPNSQVRSETTYDAYTPTPAAYYWRVRANLPGIGWSAWSNVESTTVTDWFSYVSVSNSTGGNMTVEIVGIEKKNFAPGLSYWRSIPPGQYRVNAWARCGSGSWTWDLSQGEKTIYFSCGYVSALSPGLVRDDDSH